MKKIVRNVFALLLALTFILSLAACGGNSASSGAAPAASGSEETSTVASTPETKDPVTLTVYTWWDVTKFEHLQKMKSDFDLHILYRYYSRLSIKPQVAFKILSVTILNTLPLPLLAYSDTGCLLETAPFLLDDCCMNFPLCILAFE